MVLYYAMDPVDAFEWLLREFRRYTRLESTWIEVRRVLTEAETILAAYRGKQRDPEPHMDHPYQ